MIVLLVVYSALFCAMPKLAAKWKLICCYTGSGSGSDALDDVMQTHIHSMNVFLKTCLQATLHALVVEQKVASVVLN